MQTTSEQQTDTSRRNGRQVLGAQSRPRSERNRRVRHRRTWVIPVLATAAIVVVIACTGLLLAHVTQGGATPVGAVAAETPLPDQPISAVDGSTTASAKKAVPETSPVEIEVPNVVGKSIVAAEALLSGAGFKTQTRVADKTVAGTAANTIVSQWPQAGARLVAGQRVVLTYQPKAVATTPSTKFVVVIDAGHQATQDSAQEPIGPGSSTMKPKVASGATGHFTHIPEYKGTLAIALDLRTLLQAQGVKVVMVRTTNNVDIPNSQRARIGNDAHADLVVRIHQDDAWPSQGVHGVLTEYPSGNSWVRPIQTPSHAAADLMESAMVRVTGAANRGVRGVDNMSGFNYSTVPSIIVECGLLSNPAEDHKMATPAYRQKLADGLSAGVMAYLHSR